MLYLCHIIQLTRCDKSREEGLVVDLPSVLQFAMIQVPFLKVSSTLISVCFLHRMYFGSPQKCEAIVWYHRDAVWAHEACIRQQR